jgi:putative transposase
MKLNKAFKFRLLPNKTQIDLITKTFGCCRFIYNKMLEDKIKYYEKTKKHLLVTPAKYKQEFEWLKEVDSRSLCNEQINLQVAFKNFFRNPKIGFPKFKSKKNNKNSYTTNNVNKVIRINNNHQIHLGKLNWVNFKEHRKIPVDYKIKSATIIKTSSGKYYISVLTEYEYEIPKRVLDKNKSIGLDYSSHDFYVDNQGKSPENLHHYYRDLQNKIAFHQRKLSHMVKGSNNYLKQKIVIARIHERISNQRKDFIEKESTKLANLYDIICLEDIDLSNIAQSLKLGKSTLDNAFGIFRTRLEQKMMSQGKLVIKIDKWFPSSRLCRFCGCINKDLRLSDRIWKCECGRTLNRDENSAINILNEGLKQII